MYLITQDWERLYEVYEKEIQVVIYANNRFEGNGPTTVQRLAALLEGRGYRVWRRAHEG